MAISYYLSNLASDLAGGVIYRNRLIDTPATAASITIPVTNGATEDSFGYTDAGIPAANVTTGTGNYTVLVNVTTGTTDIFCQIGLTRVNSAGVAQTNSAFTVEQGMTAGQKTFSLTAISLGTWATGDRLRVNYRFRSNRTHGGPSQILIEANTVNAEVATPWTASQIINDLVNIALSNNIDNSNLLNILSQILLDKYLQDEEIGGALLEEVINLLSTNSLTTFASFEFISQLLLNKTLNDLKVPTSFLETSTVLEMENSIFNNAHNIVLALAQLSESLDLNIFNILVHNVFITLSKHLSNEELVNLTLLLLIELENSLNIESLINIFETILASITLSKNINIQDIVLLIANVSIQLQKLLTVEQYNIAILNLIVSIYSTYQDTSSKNVILDTYITLSKHMSKESAASFAISAFIALYKNTNTTINSEYIANAIVSLSLLVDSDTLLNALLNISIILSNYYNVNVLDKGAGITEALGLSQNISITSLSIASHLLHLALNSILNSELNTSSILHVSTIENLHLITFAEFISGLNVLLSLNSTTFVDNSSRLTVTTIIQLLKSIDSSVYSINNIYNSNINMTLLTSSELRKTIESINDLSIASFYTVFTELLSGITDSITLNSNISNLIVSNITLQGILELSKSTIIQLSSLGVITTDINLVKAISLHLLTSLIQEVGIDISNIFVIENSFGFDITVETPDKRIYIIHFENRELKITRSDREADIYSSNRKSDI